MVLKSKLISSTTVDTIIHRLSTIYQPFSAIPKDNKNSEITSKSQKLMLELGLIKSNSPGCFTLLPIASKAVDKLKDIVNRQMRKIEGQKVIFPTLIKENLWETSGRLNDTYSELFKIEDRHKHKYLLGPTHEEIASELLSSSLHSYKQFPLKLYQIGSKFRDEMKPRFGLIRGREFLMKDMYSFDTTLKAAMESYETVCDSYDSIFKLLGMKVVKVSGLSGTMGGNLSHEFHFPVEVGEDLLLRCRNCKFTANFELAQEKKCLKCNESVELDLSRGIEVGHTFVLGDRYSKPFGASYLSSSGETLPLQMGCYGLGLSRIVSASLEVLSKENELRWPFALAPYNVVIIPPKSGSKEESFVGNLVEKLYFDLESLIDLKDNVLIDDRTNLTIGKRFLEAKRMGYPFVIVLGRKIMENPQLFELIDVNNETEIVLEESELFQYLDRCINR